MQYRRLGKAGVQVSVIGLGTNRFGSEVVSQDQVNNIIDAALDVGINFIDTADAYTKGDSERTLGVALKGRWDKVVLATKFYFPTGEGPNDKGNSRHHILNAVEASLQRLDSDHIDLYYVHRWDAETPIEETLRALDDLIRQGKVRYLGASNFASWQLAHSNLLAEISGWTQFVALQSHYHLLERDVEREVRPYCDQFEVGFIPYFPLAGGFLTGKYKRREQAPVGSRGESSPYVQKYMTDSSYDIVENLEVWAKDHDRNLYELAEAWLMAQPSVCSVISGATKVEHVFSNAKAADWSLSESDLEEIEAIITPEKK
ncbi:MAG: aldo/keto reductase [Anaerolineales bacterium]|nr:aldo/keto reductase [Chloroflexota bacterium]MBL6981372.1 aldo/keto reductase [Anaerolineales bacterium]